MKRFRSLELEIENLRNNLGLEPHKVSIPEDPLLFNQELGSIPHPADGRPCSLTGYQLDYLNAVRHYRYRMVIKSNKIGMTTTCAREIIHLALTRCRGKEILVIAQKYQLAIDHLETLFNILTSSKKYSQFLDFKDTTKGVIHFTNSSKVIACPPSMTSIMSWKNVGHVLMSDVAFIEMTDDWPIYRAASSRIANYPLGSLTIETPPNGRRGFVWELYAYDDSFKKFVYPYQLAVQAGLISDEFIETAKTQLGEGFKQFYECDFSTTINAAYPQSAIEQGFSYEYDLEELE